MRVVFEELYYSANIQKIADKKKADYQEALEKSHADSATQSRDSYMKDPEKSRICYVDIRMCFGKHPRTGYAFWCHPVY